MAAAKRAGQKRQKDIANAKKTIQKQKKIELTISDGIKVGVVTSPSIREIPFMELPGRIITDEEILVAKTDLKGRNVTVTLVDSMDLDEMLEASKAIEMGRKGEKIPVIKSMNVRKYVGTVLRLNKSARTKRIAEKMVQKLNTRILEINKKTTNAAESKRLYQDLMAEE